MKRANGQSAPNAMKADEGAVKKINTQARATILWKLGLVDAAKKKNEPEKAYNKQADREMPCTKCNKY